MKRLIILLISIVLVSGCVIHPKNSKHHGKTVKRLPSLEVEHKDKAIIIVHVAPAKTRGCRKHNNHWHCRK
ncbi:hypothetical protein [Pleionea sediminis]|uniref:hypothetical protein n=1 Tax=Pleionea sediminis TaxID=2569479 RepID=UPI0011851C5F|nr:hypothetical protein [Pleionea sediminis]